MLTPWNSCDWRSSGVRWLDCVLLERSSQWKHTGRYFHRVWLLLGDFQVDRHLDNRDEGSSVTGYQSLDEA